jgi:hypothetical protein
MAFDPFAPLNVNVAAIHPIIYVRGFAATRSEIDETSADPFCGFNLGSTIFRATPDADRKTRKFVFESPVVRLAKDFGYRDVYVDGSDVVHEDDWPHGISRRSIIVHRYYDSSSTILGDGETPPITDFAIALSKLIARVRRVVMAKREYPDDASFRCYLVAHSMGGLVCRAFLQNSACDPANMRSAVDKFFTYATPHNGIDLGGINVPAWLTKVEVDNFNRQKMAEYLKIDETLFADQKRVDYLPAESFSPTKVFCLIGSNRLDYDTAMGLSRTFAGNGSDGLVRIENAWLTGTRDGRPVGDAEPIAKAFVYRAHSGPYGIVNSEEGYQNLTRFLFGDIRIDVWVDIDRVTLPPRLEEARAQGKAVNALYQIELLASPRGKPWYLTRRVAEEDSVAVFTHAAYEAAQGKPISLYVSTVFLSQHGKVDKARPTLAYALTLGIRVPDYEIDRKLWLNDHFEGGYVFRDSVVVELMPSADLESPWQVRYDWQQDGKEVSPWRDLNVEEFRTGTLNLPIPFAREKRPGAQGSVRFVVRAWNSQ